MILPYSSLTSIDALTATIPILEDRFALVWYALQAVSLED